jgi:predicted Zn-dependent protease
MQATHDPKAQAGLIRRLAAASLAQPDPPGWVRVVLDTHPTPVQRVAMSRAAALREGS